MVNLARASRREAALTSPRGTLREFLVFSLAGELYAVELTKVREILSPPPITEVPRAPRQVLGVCSVRGMLVTVVDLRRRLGVEESPPTRRSRLLLAPGEEDEMLGLLVDEVKHVVRLAESQIEIASNVLGGDPSEHVLGVGRPDDDLVLVLLDIGSVMSSRKEAREW